ncbi:hypothetical protein QE450_004200 [Paenibacillus sp. SORGH_AS306]|uniref:hypothetical protein n=1 Tax=unclassified Paenibacillus TaxID=185978 RepID=UPI00278B13DC|nr:MULTISPECIES: hypothetical protein [unclassified Paenibacillus]MDQ1236702.1 hypothetical protein [Paenibacillus sp. SORGH_AS_0306]MDR6109059.1 hypothetical protein [Paenibacillus sp. SORGH_AS_0338]
MSSRVSSATDEGTRLSITEVGDIFSRARRGADDLRSLLDARMLNYEVFVMLM